MGAADAEVAGTALDEGLGEADVDGLGVALVLGAAVGDGLGVGLGLADGFGVAVGDGDATALLSSSPVPTEATAGVSFVPEPSSEVTESGST